MWAQRDSNPRPTAPQAAILSKLNYEPLVHANIRSYIRFLSFYMPIYTIQIKTFRVIPYIIWLFNHILSTIFWTHYYHLQKNKSFTINRYKYYGNLLFLCFFKLSSSDSVMIKFIVTLKELIQD